MAFRSTRQAPGGVARHPLRERSESPSAATRMRRPASSRPSIRWTCRRGDPAAVASGPRLAAGRGRRHPLHAGGGRRSSGASCSPSCAPARTRRRSPSAQSARFQGPGLRSIDRETGRHRGVAARGDPGRAPGLLRPLVPARKRAFSSSSATPIRTRCSKAAEAAFGELDRARGPPGTRGAAGRVRPSAAWTRFTQCDPGPAARRERLPDRPARRTARPRASSGCAARPFRRSGSTILADRAAQPTAQAGFAAAGRGAGRSTADLPDARIACLIAVPNRGQMAGRRSPKPRPSCAASPRPGRPPLEVETAAEQLRSRLRARRLPERHPRHPRSRRSRSSRRSWPGRPFQDPERGDAGLRPARGRD